MGVTLSIKNVPDEVVERLRVQARGNHRSLQGELLAMVERVAAQASMRPVTVEQLHDWARAQGFSGAHDSTADIRRMRDERSQRLDQVLEQARVSHRRQAALKKRGRRKATFQKPACR